MIEPSILIVDSDAKRIVWFRHFMADLGIRVLTEEVQDSRALFALLQKRGKSGEAGLPLCIFVGVELCGAPEIRAMRAQLFLERVPIIVFQTTANSAFPELLEAGADACIHHPPAGGTLTAIYQKARLIREGTIKRKWAFNALETESHLAPAGQ